MSKKSRPWTRQQRKRIRRRTQSSDWVCRLLAAQDDYYGNPEIADAFPSTRWPAITYTFDRAGNLVRTVETPTR